MKNSPYSFPHNYDVSNVSIKYNDLIELGQSGIKIGKISLDNYTIKQFDFGGPCLFKDNYLFLPMYKRSFFRSGFILTMIDIKKYKIQTMGNMKPLIWLDTIENNKLYFYEDIEKKRKSFYLLK